MEIGKAAESLYGRLAMPGPIAALWRLQRLGECLRFDAITQQNLNKLAAVPTPIPGIRQPAARQPRLSRTWPRGTTVTSGAIALISSCNAARRSWMDTSTGPIGTPRSTSTASES